MEIKKENHQEKLPIMEIFDTIQGEGSFAGKAANFIRLAGCDIGCHWCDVKESWEARPEQWISIEKILGQLNKDISIVVITGGEPLMYDMNLLTKILKKNNFDTHIETSGAYPLTGVWDWVVLSPKKNKLPVEAIYQKTDELKMIVYNNHDLEWAKQLGSKLSDKAIKTLQSEWGKKEDNYKKIVNFVKTNSNWKISVQIHKYLNIR